MFLDNRKCGQTAENGIKEEISEASDTHDEHVNVDEDPDDHGVGDGQDAGVIDLSSSGFCSWCHKPGPCSLLSDSEVVGGKRLRKRYCSER